MLAYLDPGSGSMLLGLVWTAVLVAVVVALVFLVRRWIRQAVARERIKQSADS